MSKRRAIVGLAILVLAQGFMASSRLSASTRGVGQLDGRGVAATLARGTDNNIWCLNNCGTECSGAGNPLCCDAVSKDTGIHWYCYYH